MAAAPQVTIVRFSSGADIKEFVALMRDAAAFDFAGWRFIPIEQVVIDREGREISLTSTETRILFELVRAFPNPLEVKVIVRRANVGSPDTVKSTVFNLRRLLGQQVILNKGKGYGGYRFSGMPLEVAE